jgi:hypothetical protein
MGTLKAALKAFFPNNNGDANFAANCLVPYFDNNNDPKGCVSTSKLAEVLGGLILGGTLEIAQNADLDTLISGKACSYICPSGARAGTLTHSPITTGAFFMFSFGPFAPANTTYAVQIVLNFTGIYFRGKNADNSWQTWKQVSLS